MHMDSSGTRRKAESLLREVTGEAFTEEVRGELGFGSHPLLFRNLPASLFQTSFSSIGPTRHHFINILGNILNSLPSCIFITSSRLCQALGDPGVPGDQAQEPMGVDPPANAQRGS